MENLKKENQHLQFMQKSKSLAGMLSERSNNIQPHNIMGQTQANYNQQRNGHKSLNKIQNIRP